MASHQPALTQQPVRRAKVRKGTFSCRECHRRKKRCLIPSDSIAGICTSCQRLGCACISQDHDEEGGSSSEVTQKRLEHVERLATALIHQRRQRQQSTPTQPLACQEELFDALTGAGEDRTSRCRSLSGYFYSVLPHPFTASLMEGYGKGVYEGLNETLRLTKASHEDRRDFTLSEDLQPAFLARRLIRLAVCLMYMDSTSSEHIRDLQLSESAMETSRRYVEAARHLTCEIELLQSTAGLECVTMDGYYSVHLGRIGEAGNSFRRALHLAQRIGLPEKAAAAEDDQGTVARNACFHLISANRMLALCTGQACDAIDDHFTKWRDGDLDQPLEQLNRINVRIWRRIISRNVRTRQAWICDPDREIALHAELAETLSIDQDLKLAMLSIPSTWWQLPSIPDATTRAVSKESFLQLNTTKDHYHTIVLTHLPYALHAAISIHGSPFSYSKAAAISASRQVLIRWPLYQRFKHVPASYRALEHKSFIASIVLLLSHMHSHHSTDFDALVFERPKDLNLLSESTNSMEALFARDQHNPGSECARILRRLMDIEQDMACGTDYSMSWCCDGAGRDFSVDTAALDVRLPYFGTIHIERESDVRHANDSFFATQEFDLNVLDAMIMEHGNRA